MFCNFEVMILGILLVLVGLGSLCFQFIRKLSKEYVLHKTKKTPKYKAFLKELEDLI